MHAMAIFEDMLAVGLPPERETFHLLFQVRPLACTRPGFFADFGIGPFTTTPENSLVVVE